MERPADREPEQPASPSPLARAYHEAGHVVVATYFGLPTTDVTIVRDGDALGMVKHPPPLMLDLGEARVGVARRQAARQMIIASYAGLAAERLVDARAPDFRGAADDANAMQLSREYAVLPRHCGFVGDDLHLDFLERLRRDAGRLVKRLRPALDVPAQELLRRKTIPGDDAAAIVEPIIEGLSGKRR